MKTLFALGAVLAAGTTSAIADPSGAWRTEEGETGGYAIVTIGQCSDGSGHYCGTITDILGNDNTSSIGAPIITSMEHRGEGKYRGGQIWAPDQDRWYNSRMTLKSDGTLTVYGCLVGGLICRGQNWTRVDEGSDHLSQ